jgi:hypothetical protein
MAVTTVNTNMDKDSWRWSDILWCGLSTSASALWYTTNITLAILPSALMTAGMITSSVTTCAHSVRYTTKAVGLVHLLAVSGYAATKSIVLNLYQYKNDKNEIELSASLKKDVEADFEETTLTEDFDTSEWVLISASSAAKPN